MLLRLLQRLNGFRITAGLSAIVSWLIAGALFGIYAIALHASLDRPNRFLGGAAWMLGLIGLFLTAKFLGRDRASVSEWKTKVVAPPDSSSRNTLRS